MDSLEYFKTVSDVIYHQQLPNNIIENCFKNNLFIEELCSMQSLPVNIMQKYSNKLCWNLISLHQYMDLPFLIENFNLIKWELMPFNNKMSTYITEGLLILFQNSLIWDNIPFSNIDTKILLKYKHKFTVKTFESFQNSRNLSREQIENM